MIPTRCLVLLILLTATPVSVHAASAAEEFGARRWPVKSVLVLNGDPTLCKTIADDVTKKFASSADEINVALSIAEEFPPLEPQRVGKDDDYTLFSLTRLDLDLDATGHTQVVVYRIQSFRDMEYETAFVIPSVAEFDSLKLSLAQDGFTENTSQEPALTSQQKEINSHLYFPTATMNGQNVSTGEGSSAHSLFEFNKRYYFVAGGLDPYRPGRIPVYRLRANAHVELACQFELPDVDLAYAMFQRLPGMTSFLAIIRAIGSGDGSRMHDAQATGAEVRAAFRPWATSAETKPAYEGDQPYYRYDQRTQAFLEAWSLEDIWNRREYQTLMELTAAAEASYATYLQSTFGVSTDPARLNAIKVIQELIGARLQVPNQFTTDQIRLYFPSTPLHQAVLRRDRTAFDAALANPQSATDQAFGRAPKSTPEILSEAVPDAVEWPYALDQLLGAGADPNHVNAFGKTPLMVAAHFDRPDSVKKLLEAGAKVDAVTTAGSATWMDEPKRTGRTALMYAAENAGPAVIKAMLDAGANANARDSAGNELSFYLANNPRFTAAERALGVIGLAKIADQFSGPSFSCEKAQSSTERAICDSDVLRIFDAQISRGFAQLLPNERQAALSEQRAWLHSRDKSCGGDQDCLAEMMRTHLRSLHERVAEAATPTAKQP
jgi:uncharacterized protein YecT (DUF1311 family)